MKRFNQLQPNQVVKDQSHVDCSNRLIRDSGIDQDISFRHTVELCATVNHSGTLEAGHYVAHVKEEKDLWSICYGKAVTISNGENVNNNSSYILFLKRLLFRV